MGLHWVSARFEEYSAINGSGTRTCPAWGLAGFLTLGVLSWAARKGTDRSRNRFDDGPRIR